jgi:phage-related protein
LIKNIIQTVMNFIKGIIKAVWGFIGPYVKAAVNTMKVVITTVWNAIKDATTKVWDGIKGVVEDAIVALIKTVMTIKAKITGFFKGAVDWLKDAGKDIIQGLIDGIMAMIDKVRGAVETVTDAVGKFLPGSPVKEGPLKVLNRGHAGKQIVGMMIEGIESMAPALAAAMDLTTGAGVTLAAPTPPATQGRVRARRNQASTGLRLIEGRLTLDRDGKAFIRGVAEEVVDSDKRLAGIQRSMRRGR